MASEPARLHVQRETYAIDTIPRDDVLHYLGYHGQGMAAALVERIDEVVARCLRISQPAGALLSFPVGSVDENGVALGGCALTLPGNDIAQHLAGATEVVLMAVTIGAAADRELRLLSLTDPVEQVLFDAAATALVERAADAAEAHARAYVHERGLYSSWRFSPGYGDFPLEVQPAFLSALDATRRLGITLTPSNLMIPTKSVTAVIGAHGTPQPGLASSCSICSLAAFCELRRRGTPCLA